MNDVVMIVDGDGVALAEGVAAADALRVARSIAADLGKSVWAVFPVEGEEAEEPVVVEVAPPAPPAAVLEAARRNARSAPAASALPADLDVSDERRALLERAAAGASAEVLRRLASATLVAEGETIVLPSLRYESLSRGRGWARRGRGDSVEWGVRVPGGYRVGPGRWIVGATDGFSRRDSRAWTVAHVAVGESVWTVAS
jgi:hypothetical protein